MCAPIWTRKNSTNSWRLQKCALSESLPPFKWFALPKMGMSKVTQPNILASLLATSA